MRDAKTFADALASSPAASLLQRVALSEAAAKTIEAADVLPPGFNPCQPGICELRDGVLWLSACSPAEAAKLRQGLPRLLTLLLRNGFELNEIKVRLQPSLTAYQTPDSSAAVAISQPEPSPAGGSARAIPAAPLAFAEELSLTLPDSKLRDAARALANRLRAGVRKV